ncbi:hypothetical protein GCM10010350_37850 [Streptomyces galilaeus]|nr:hypothetical protein GCM10010350_37850 [Streptomyces galilaeus]
MTVTVTAAGMVVRGAHCDGRLRPARDWGIAEVSPEGTHACQGRTQRTECRTEQWRLPGGSAGFGHPCLSRA